MIIHIPLVYAITQQSQSCGCPDNDSSFSFSFSLMPQHILLTFIFPCFLLLCPPGEWDHLGWLCIIIVRFHAFPGSFTSYGISFLHYIYITRLHPGSLLCFYYSSYSSMFTYTYSFVFLMFAPLGSLIPASGAYYSCCYSVLFDALSCCGGYIRYSPSCQMDGLLTIHKK